jgi:hypothetical protein
MDLYLDNKKIGQTNLNPKYTLGEVKTSFANWARDNNLGDISINIVFNNGETLNPIVFQTNKYDKINFVDKKDLLKGGEIRIKRIKKSADSSTQNREPTKNEKFTGMKDIDLKILSQLEDKDLFNMCLVNTYVSNLCKDEILWKNRLFKNYKKFLSIAKRYYTDRYGEVTIEEEYGKNLEKLNNPDSWKKIYISILNRVISLIESKYKRWKIDLVRHELIRRNIKNRGNKSEMIEWIVEDELYPQKDPNYITIYLKTYMDEIIIVRVKPEETLKDFFQKFKYIKGDEKYYRIRKFISKKDPRYSEPRNDITDDYGIWRLVDKKLTFREAGIENDELLRLTLS